MDAAIVVYVWTLDNMYCIYGGGGGMYGEQCVCMCGGVGYIKVCVYNICRGALCMWRFVCVCI